MRRILVLLAGCGRFGFAQHAGAPDANGTDAAAAADAPGHDEDGDGIPDAVDNCPCTASANLADADGDGVGDACDPHPSAAGDRLALFATFATTMSPFAMMSGTVSVQGDALHVEDAALYTEMSAPLAIQSGQVIVAGDIASLAPSGTHQIASAVYTSMSGPRNYGELYDDGTSRYLALSQYDGTSFTSVYSTPMPMGFQPGVFSLVLTVELGTWDVAGGFGGNVLDANGTVMYFNAPGTTVDLGMIGFVGDVRAVCAVASP